MRTRTWTAALPLACVPPAAFLVLPPGPARLVYHLTCFGSVTVAAVLVRRQRPDQPLPWWLLIGGLTVLSVRDVLVAPPSRGGLTGAPRDVVDPVLMLGGYLLLLGGTYLLVRIRTRHRDRDSFIDGAVVAVGIAVVLWEALAHAPKLQYADGYGDWLVFAVLQSVLLAMTVRFIISGCARLPAALALFGAAVFGFAGNLAIVWVGGSSDPVPHSWISSLWMLAWLCVLLAAAHPSMRLVAVSATQSAAGMPIARMALLCVSLTLAPGAVFLATIDELRDAGGAAASAVLALLIVWRLVRLVAQREADRARQVAVVELGHQALTGVELTGLFERAADLVRSTLPLATVSVLESDGDLRLVVTADYPAEPDEHVFLESVQHVLDAAVARRKAEDAVRYLATHDHLTGLANRALINDRLNHALRRAAREKTPMAVVFVDLDGFKVANDLFGHDAGDAVLVAVARRLESTLRGGDTVGRLAGDEFALICESVGSVGDAVVLAERIIATVCRPVEVEGGTATVAASVGVALTTGEGDGEAALRAADAAMYRAKRQGSNRYLIDHHGVRLSR